MARAVPDACFIYSPQSVVAGQSVTFDGSCSFDDEPANTIVRWQWDFDRDGSIDADDAHPTAVFSYATPAVYFARLDVWNDRDPAQSDAYNLVVQVAHPPPVACFQMTPNPVVVGGQVLFDASCSTGSGSLSYLWDVDGDGLFDHLEAATQWTYTSVGPVNVGLRVIQTGGGLADLRTEVLEVWGNQCATTSDCPADAGQCQLYECNLGLCELTSAAPGTPCEDGDDCTMDTACDADQLCAGGAPTDLDGDGFVVTGCADGDDCNDASAAIHPGMTEIPFNHLDDDCNLDTPVPGLPGACASVSEGGRAPDWPTGLLGFLTPGLAIAGLAVRARRGRQHTDG
ncbi:MAG: PKD domain-containing protein [Deltaproteobacteria bacterium]|nr:PKD domain-containing protein [Deltaproteobacteria bacterium]